MPTGEVQRVADILLERILSGTYAPGIRLPSETELAQNFGCGRSTVRESLRHLADLGVVMSKKGSGAVVLDYRTEGRSMALLGPWLLTAQFDLPLSVLTKELLDTRTHLACTGARLASLYAKDLSEARALVEASVALESDPVAHSRNDLELHRALAGASRIWPAVWLLNSLRGPINELSARFPTIATVPEGYAARMHELLDLVEAHNAEAAVAHLRAHLDTVDGVLLDLVAQFENLTSEEDA